MNNKNRRKKEYGINLSILWRRNSQIKKIKIKTVLELALLNL